MSIRSTSAIQAPSNTDAVSGAIRRWLPVALVITALVATLTMLVRHYLGVENSAAQTAGSLLTLTLSAIVTGAGLITLFWLLGPSQKSNKLGLTRRANQEFADTTVAKLPPATPIKAAGDDESAPFRMRYQTIRAFGRCGYWSQDAAGRYKIVEPSGRGGQTRLLDLLGSIRGEANGDTMHGMDANELSRLIAAREPFTDIVWRRRLPTGESLRVRESGAPQFDESGQFIGYHGSIEEISEQTMDPVRSKLATNALAAVPTPAMLLYRGEAHDASENHDERWRLVWANAPLSTLTERNPIELGDIDPMRWLLCAPSSPDMQAIEHADYPDLSKHAQVSALHQILIRGETHKGQGLLIDRFGRRHAVLLTIERLEHNSTGSLALVVADRQTAEFESLKTETASIREAQRDEARRALDMKVTARELESFSHTVSHDLRHPVRIVDGFARILLEDYAAVLDRTGLEHLNRILSSAHRMNSMIDALLELHRISSQPVVPDPVDLSAMAHSVADELKAGNPGRQIDIDIEAGLACRGDRILLRMMLWNLMENAWKYSAKNEQARISFGSETVQESVVYRVKDNGAGFDMRFSDRLFDLFHRLHGSGDFKGSGIGLATVQRIIRRHGGHVWAESEINVGSTFQFTLWNDRETSRDI